MGWTDVGAGAAAGLQDLLKQHLVEQQMADRQAALQASQTETQRSHMAEEGLKGRQIDVLGETNRQTAADREANQASLAAARKATAANLATDNRRAVLQMRPAGTVVDPSTRNADVEAGAASPEQFTDLGPVNGPYQPGEERPSLGFRQEPTAAQTKDQQAHDEKVREFDEREKDRQAAKAAAGGNQVVQSGSGYYRVPRQGGAASPVMGPDGQPLGLATSTQTRSMQEGARMIQPHIAKVAQQAEELDKAGLFGPLAGRVRDLATQLGTVKGLASENPDDQQHAMDALGVAIENDPQLANDRRVGRFAANLGLLMTGAARVHGGARGGGSPQMLAHFKGLLGATGTLPMFLGRLDALNDYMSTYAGMADEGAGTGSTDQRGSRGQTGPAAPLPSGISVTRVK